MVENIDQATLDRLIAFGLSITQYSDPSYGWGYTWQGRDLAGPFSTASAALHAAFTEALYALQFRSDYSWVLLAQPGELWRFGGEGEGWVHVGGPGAKDDTKQERKQPPDYDVRSQQQERAWWAWADQASDEELLNALHRCSLWSDIPAHVTRTQLQERGYILIGGQPHEVMVEREREANP